MSHPRFTLTTTSTLPWGTEYVHDGLTANDVLTMLPERERVRADTAMESMERAGHGFEWQSGDIEFIITREA